MTAFLANYLAALVRIGHGLNIISTKSDDPNRDLNILKASKIGSRQFTRSPRDTLIHLLSDPGNFKIKPGPLSPLYLPNANTANLSFSEAILIIEASKKIKKNDYQ